MNEKETKERIRKKPTLIVSALIEKEGKFLLLKEPKFDFWRPPGGRMDWGEKVEDTLRREISEELGAEIEIVKPLGFGEDRAFQQVYKYRTNRVILYFLCRLKTQIKRYSDDEQGGKPSEPRWVTKEEIEQEENLEPAMKDMFKRFGI